MIVTLTVSEPITATPYGWTPYGSNKYRATYVQNRSESVYFANMAGKTGSAYVSVTNIDKTPPTIQSVDKTPNTMTNGTVKLTIYASDYEAGLDVLPYSFDGGQTRQSTASKTFSSNQTVSIRVKDKAGNISSTNSTITNIDASNPTATVSYSPAQTARTNKDVTVTLTADKDINTPSGWTKVNSKVYTKIYTANSSSMLDFTDTAGNAGSVNIAVTKIDKVLPACGTWNPSSNVAFTGTAKFILANSTDVGGAGINKAGGDCTVTTN